LPKFEKWQYVDSPGSEMPPPVSARSSSGLSVDLLKSEAKAESLLSSGGSRWNLSDLTAPLPNLFRATFEQAHKQMQGENWLQQKIEEFDKGGKHKRKLILEEFLNYVRDSSASSMSGLFSHQAQLFFVRLTSWFSVTLPVLFELPLQLNVFLVYLEFREQALVRAFFETGTVIPLMHALSASFDVPDEVRTLVLKIFHRLASNGRHFKELLCQLNLVKYVLECVADGLRWETLKCAGRLLSELFRSNPKCQLDVFDALQSLMRKDLPAMAQRVGTQGAISILTGEGHGQLMQDPERHVSLVRCALDLLESQDLRVGADAYCLLCHMIRLFNCDELLHGFASSQLTVTKDNSDEWIRMEEEAHLHFFGHRTQESGPSLRPPPFGGILAQVLYQRISEAVERNPAVVGTEEAVKTNTEFCTAFRLEAGQILKWAVLLFLVKRDDRLCERLVDTGLTETLLMHLVDVRHPVRQASALAELHRLQLLSAKARMVAEKVLKRQDLLRAMTLDEFMRVATYDDLQRARYNLRNMRPGSSEAKAKATSANELALRQKIIERDMASDLNMHPTTSGKTPFLTEAESAQAGNEADSNTISVPRSGHGTFDVKRTPLSDGDLGGLRSSYKLELSTLEDVPFWGSLASMIVDPLELLTDEDSPLIHELDWKPVRSDREALSHRSVSSAASRRRRLESEQPVKSSHRSNLSHFRELVLRVPPCLPGVPRPRKRSEHRRPRRLPERPLSSGRESIASQETELSVRMTRAEDFQSEVIISPRREKVSKLKLPALDQQVSQAETSLGPEQFSRDQLSSELSAWHEASLDRKTDHPSMMDSLAVETSICQSIGPESGSLLDRHQHHRCCGHHAAPQMPLQVDVNELYEEALHGQVVLRSSSVAVVELRRRDDFDLSKPPPRAQKRILHVAPAPYHDCLAFDRTETERDRQRAVDNVDTYLQPKTRAKFKKLQDEGKFPRKRLVPGSCRPRHLAPYPSGSVSARVAASSGSEDPDPSEATDSVSAASGPRETRELVTDHPLAAHFPASAQKQLDSAP
jgi:hypothetical protein